MKELLMQIHTVLVDVGMKEEKKIKLTYAVIELHKAFISKDTGNITKAVEFLNAEMEKIEDGALFGIVAADFKKVFGKVTKKALEELKTTSLFIYQPLKDALYKIEECLVDTGLMITLRQKKQLSISVRKSARTIVIFRT